MQETRGLADFDRPACLFQSASRTSLASRATASPSRSQRTATLRTTERGGARRGVSLCAVASSRRSTVSLALSAQSQFELTDPLRSPPLCRGRRDVRQHVRKADPRQFALGYVGRNQIHAVHRSQSPSGLLRRQAVGTVSPLSLLTSLSPKLIAFVFLTGLLSSRASLTSLSRPSRSPYYPPGRMTSSSLSRRRPSTRSLLRYQSHRRMKLL